MTIGAADVIAPMLSATKVVVIFFACVTGQTSFRDLFRSFVLEADDFCRIAFFGVRLARTVTSLAPGNFPFPTADLG